MGAPLMDAFKAVDAFLIAKYRIGLEEVLCIGCSLGHVPAAVAATAKILPRKLRSETEADGGEYTGYDGVLIVGGCWYRFGCHVFTDTDGLAFLCDLTEFEAVEWKLRLAVSA